MVRVPALETPFWETKQNLPSAPYRAQASGQENGGHVEPEEPHEGTSRGPRDWRWDGGPEDHFNV